MPLTPTAPTAMNRKTLKLTLGGLSLVPLGLTMVTTRPQTRELPASIGKVAPASSPVSWVQPTAINTPGPHGPEQKHDTSRSPYPFLNDERTNSPRHTLATRGKALSQNITSYPPLTIPTSPTPTEMMQKIPHSHQGRPLSKSFAQVDLPLVPVDATAPGSTLLVGRHPVVVEAYQEISGRPSPALTVFIADPSDTPTTDSQAQQPGFSAAEELFRTRWGWAAFEATRRAALESDSSR